MEITMEITAPHRVDVNWVAIGISCRSVIELEVDPVEQLTVQAQQISALPVPGDAEMEHAQSLFWHAGMDWFCAGNSPSNLRIVRCRLFPPHAGDPQNLFPPPHAGSKPPRTQDRVAYMLQGRGEVPPHLGFRQNRLPTLP